MDTTVLSAPSRHPFLPNKMKAPPVSLGETQPRYKMKDPKRSLLYLMSMIVAGVYFHHCSRGFHGGTQPVHKCKDLNRDLLYVMSMCVWQVCIFTIVPEVSMILRSGHTLMDSSDKTLCFMQCHAQRSIRSTST
jgi:hypothetical protein